MSRETIDIILFWYAVVVIGSAAFVPIAQLLFIFAEGILKDIKYHGKNRQRNPDG